MRVGIHTWGSEGDVRPFLALAGGLAGAGHEVRLAYASAEGRDYEPRLYGAAFEHQSLGLARPPEELARIARGIFADRNPLRQLDTTLREMLNPFLGDLARSAATLAAWADLLVLHPMAHPLAAAGEQQRKPFVCIYPAPMFPTRALVPPGAPDLGPANALTWRAMLALLSRKLVPSYNQVRSGMGLPPIRHTDEQLGRSILDMVAVSPTLVQRPVEWAEKVQLSGVLTPRPSAQTSPLEPALEAFLAAGPAPIYVTFGSMSAVEASPEAVNAIVVDAVHQAGCRAIVQAEVAGPVTPDVLWGGPASHDQIFPRCAAVVHHGGIGTTQAAMRAGRPSVVVAHFGDQFLWARQLRKLGVAPGHLSRRGLKAGTLGRAIQAVALDAGMRTRAEQLGQAMREEDGIGRAVELIERAAQTATSAPTA